MKKYTLYKITIFILLIALGAVGVYVIKPAFETKAGFNTPYLDIFDAYSSWPSSGTLKATDTMVQTLFQLYYGTTGTSSVDVNGDGLVDVLVHSGSCSHTHGKCNFGVFLNKGNLTYDLMYKCKVVTVNNIKTYYGDCAG